MANDRHKIIDFSKDTIRVANEVLLSGSWWFLRIPHICKPSIRNREVPPVIEEHFISAMEPDSIISDHIGLEKPKKS